MSCRKGSPAAQFALKAPLGHRTTFLLFAKIQPFLKIINLRNSLSEFTQRSYSVHRSLTTVAYKSALPEIANVEATGRQARISSTGKILTPTVEEIE